MMQAHSSDSAQTDRFVHDRLPPPEQRANLRFDLPELRIADQANLVDVLFGQIKTRGMLDATFLRSDRSEERRVGKEC